MNRNAALLVGALAGAAGALFLRRRAAPGVATQAAAGRDTRAEDLRRKLAEARETVGAEDEFEAAGMGAETIVADEPRKAAATAEPAPAEPPPADEFEAMRRRVHAEGRAAAEEMRREGRRDE
jgi:hypothetical protein